MNGLVEKGMERLIIAQNVEKQELQLTLLVVSFL